MDGTRGEASTEARILAIDTLARSLHAPVSRRRAVGLLASAIASGMLGISREFEPVHARKKRGKRRASRSADAAESRRGIPPNCIYVCCDGTCDSWKMCMKCVKWPKPTTASTIAR
jgi:hypothetical protein